MSKRLVTILWCIAGLLAALTLFVKYWQNREERDPSALAQGAVVLESLPLKEVAAIKLEDFEHTVTLQRDEEQWSVVERDGYKGDFPKLTRLLREMTEMTVAQSRKAGPAFNNRFGMDPDGETQEDHGYQVTFLDAEGAELQSLLVGKSTAGADAGSRGEAGQFIRLVSDPDSVYSVNEDFPDLTALPSDWLDQDFFAIEGMKTLSLVPGKESRINGWTVSRPDEAAEFAIENLTEGREVQADKLTALNTVLSGQGFEDVLSDEEAAAQRNEGKANKLTITTFDGFKYLIDYAPHKAPAPHPESTGPARPAPKSGFITKVTVSADFPKERPKKEGESEEEAKKADEAFAARQEQLQAKLELEQSLGEYYYDLAEYTLEAANVGGETLAKPVVRSEAVRPTLPGGQTPPVTPSFGPLAPPPVAPAPAPSTQAPTAVSPPVAIPPAASAPAAPVNEKPEATKAEAKAKDEAPAQASQAGGLNNSDAFDGLTEEDIKRIVEEAKDADSEEVDEAAE